MNAGIQLARKEPYKFTRCSAQLRPTNPKHCRPTIIQKALFGIAALWTFSSLASQIDEVSRSVVFLQDNRPVTEQVNGKPLEVWFKLPNTNVFIQKTQPVTGSGLIVVSRDVAYLVTAKHVASVMTEECEIVMRGDKLEPLHIKLREITGQTNISWFHDPIADLSIHPLPTITADGLLILRRRAVPLELLESQTNLPSREVYVTALGFPLGIGAMGTQFIPLSRESKVSSGILNDASGLFFLLQDPSVNGYSGGPLVESGDPRFIGHAAVSGGTRCWGFVSATYSDETGGKMCRITPAFYAAALIRKAEKELRIVSKTLVSQP